jgi:hypothetical protein
MFRRRSPIVMLIAACTLTAALPALAQTEAQVQEARRHLQRREIELKMHMIEVDQARIKVRAAEIELAYVQRVADDAGQDKLRIERAALGVEAARLGLRQRELAAQMMQINVMEAREHLERVHGAAGAGEEPAAVRPEDERERLRDVARAQNESAVIARLAEMQARFAEMQAQVAELLAQNEQLKRGNAELREQVTVLRRQREIEK